MCEVRKEPSVVTSPSIEFCRHSLKMNIWIICCISTSLGCPGVRPDMCQSTRFCFEAQDSMCTTSRFRYNTPCQTWVIDITSPSYVFVCLFAQESLVCKWYLFDIWLSLWMSPNLCDLTKTFGDMRLFHFRLSTTWSWQEKIMLSFSRRCKTTTNQNKSQDLRERRGYFTLCLMVCQEAAASLDKIACMAL